MFQPAKKRALVWFRQDLRLHDNEALVSALREADEVIPVYVFDDRTFRGTTRDYGFPKTDRFRAKFILECVEDLRQNLRKLNSELIVRTGITEDVLYELAREVRPNWVFCNRERMDEEVRVQDRLEERLWSIGQEMRYVRGKMLYHTADLPFPVSHTPDIFSQFRKEVERYVPVREPFEAPTEKFAPLSVRIEAGEMPTLAEFGHEDPEEDPRAVMPFRGGETAGLERLRYYLWDSDLVKTYKETRNQMLGGDYSTKFSIWLAQGCLSPKQIYAELKRYEAERGKNRSTYWVFFELLWRDFFRLMGKKHGNAIFQKGGIKGEPNESLSDDRRLFELWAEGRTGVPFIDANMRELKLTGFMSNRGRQNVASFLVNDLKVNWQMGAEYMESMLIDYDVASHWGNWNYVAGVGSDPRENRYFNPLKQGKRYDPEGDYVRHWIPELRKLPRERVHRPDTLDQVQQEAIGFRLGADYPRSMINMRKWA